MKKIIILIAVFITITAHAQVGINTTNPNSTLDINGSISKPVKVVNSGYVITDEDYSIIVNILGNNKEKNIKLPSAVNRKGRILLISTTNKNPSSKITIKTKDNQTINGKTSVKIGSEYKELTFFDDILITEASIKLQSDGHNWWIIGGSNI